MTNRDGAGPTTLGARTFQTQTHDGRDHLAAAIVVAPGAACTVLGLVLSA